MSCNYVIELSLIYHGPFVDIGEMENSLVIILFQISSLLKLDCNLLFVETIRM